MSLVPSSAITPQSRNVQIVNLDKTRVDGVAVSCHALFVSLWSCSLKKYKVRIALCVLLLVGCFFKKKIVGRIVGQ